MSKELILLALKPYFSKLKFIKKNIYNKVGTLNANYCVSSEPVPFNNKESLTVNPINVGDKWGGNYDCGWFHFTGKIGKESQNKKISALINVGSIGGGEGCVFDAEGKPIVGISSIGALMDALQPVWAKQEVPVVEKANGDEQIDLWVEVGYNKILINKFIKCLIPKRAKLTKMDIVEVRDDLKKLYYYYLSLITQYLFSDKETEKKLSLKKAINDVKTILTNLESETVEKAQKAIEEEFSRGEESAHTIYATGHAHLDLAWLWPLRETKRKGSRTFSTQLRNIEKYQDYVFGASQPQLFEWMKEDYPLLFEEIKQAIEKDKIEIQGGMWVEADTNVPCGESLVRQCLYGMEYWEKEFNKKTNICWLPDVFGFSGNLPQIIKKCGMDYFLTTKLSWNEHNHWKHKSFIWQGIDDSEVMVHIPPIGNYCTEGNAYTLIETIKEYTEKKDIPFSSVLYGIGDGGGGPGEGHMESITIARKQKGLPKVKLSSASDFFKRLNTYKDKMISHKGELYLEKHQGTLTTQAKTKLFNRKCEQGLHDLEFISLLAESKGYAYPKKEIEKLWKEVLLYQFHDILPGSSIQRVYVEAEARYKEILKEIKKLIFKAMSFLDVSKDLSVVNTSPFARNEYFKDEGVWYKAECEPYSITKASKVENFAKGKYTNNTMENDKIKISFNENGEIISLVTLADNEEHCKDYLNRLSVYKDKPLYFNAWDIDINYSKKTPSTFKLINYNTIVDGPCVVRVNTYKFNNSTITQKVILTQGKQYVEFKTEVDWQEKHKMLRADFVPRTYSNEVRCDIQFGNIKRSTKNDTSIEKAQFEICAHKWVDMQNENRGISLINDCKYGHRVKEGIISLNLLRSSVWPDENADRGNQAFNYALYPYKGSFEDNDTQEIAYAFNSKLIPVKTGGISSIASACNKNIVIETIKKAQNQNSIVMRVYESQGKETKTEIKCSIDYDKCIETDMLENDISEVKLNNLIFKPFEVKTLLLKNKAS